MRWLSLFWLMLLGGCALLPHTPPPAGMAVKPNADQFALNGRISIDDRGKRHSAGLRWLHRPQSDEILLLAPLGATAARIYRDKHSAVLEDGDKRYRAASAESLMQQVLGWHLPLAGMHYWVLGQASKGRPAQLKYDKEGRIASLQQDGWEVSYLRYADNLPARLQLSHAGLKVLLLIDEWDWNPQ